MQNSIFITMWNHINIDAIKIYDAFLSLNHIHSLVFLNTFSIHQTIVSIVDFFSFHIYFLTFLHCSTEILNLTTTLTYRIKHYLFSRLPNYFWTFMTPFVNTVGFVCIETQLFSFFLRGFLFTLPWRQLYPLPAHACSK